MKIFLSLLVRLLIFLISLVLCLPIILTPLSTPVPAWIWLPLAVLGMVAITLQFRITPTWKGISVGLVAITLTSLLAVVISQSYAFTPPITEHPLLAFGSELVHLLNRIKEPT